MKHLTAQSLRTSKEIHVEVDRQCAELQTSIANGYRALSKQQLFSVTRSIGQLRRWNKSKESK